MSNTITPREDGPYKVSGEITLTDADGNEIPVPKNPFFLCRCGNSKNKPFCDGTHSKIEFKAPSRPAE